MYIDQPIHSWEPASSAVTRFEQFMTELLAKKEFNSKTVGIVSHGTVLSLYFAKVGNYIYDPDLLYQKWNKTTFCSYGIMIDSKILQELSEAKN